MLALSIHVCVQSFIITLISLFVQLGASPREDGVTTATRSWAKENVHTQ